MENKKGACVCDWHAAPFSAMSPSFHVYRRQVYMFIFVYFYLLHKAQSLSTLASARRCWCPGWRSGDASTSAPGSRGPGNTGWLC